MMQFFSNFIITKYTSAAYSIPISSIIYMFLLKKGTVTVNNTFVTERIFPPNGTSSVTLTSYGITGSATCTVSTAYTFTFNSVSFYGTFFKNKCYFTNTYISVGD